MATRCLDITDIMCVQKVDGTAMCIEESQLVNFPSAHIGAAMDPHSDTRDMFEVSCGLRHGQAVEKAKGEHLPAVASEEVMLQ